MKKNSHNKRNTNNKNSKESIRVKLKQTLSDLISLKFQDSVSYNEANEQNVFIYAGGTNCHRKGQGILMYDGTIKKVEDIIVGEQIMGPDSTPRNILSLARGIDDMVEITPNKGNPWVVNMHHVLTLQETCLFKKIKGKVHYLKTDKSKLVDIAVNEYLNLSKKKKHILKLVRTGVEFNKKTLSIKPYHLGLLIGAGGLTKGSPNITTMDDEILKEIHLLAKDYSLNVAPRKQRKNNKAITYAMSDVINHGGGRLNLLTSALRKIGLYGKGSGDKFIPIEYKTSSREDRLELLAGLMDTDGSLDGLKTSFDYITKSKQLADDVAFIARSVGLSAYPKKCKKQIKSNGFEGEYYRLSLSGDNSIIPTRLPRKKADGRKINYNVLRTGFKTKVLPKEDFYGFEIDGDHRYLLDDFTITHNSGKTFGALQHLRKVPEGQKGAYLAPLRLLAAEVSQTLTEDGYPCSLLTGQERKFIKGARLTASTVEMFNTDHVFHTIVLDEAQMSGEDSQRGHSWTNILLHAKCQNLYIICAPYAVPLITEILSRTNRKCTIKHHERFTKLTVATVPDRLDKIEDNTIVVAFSKNDVLELKEFFANQGRKTVAIYGSLPPETRLAQVAYFNSGEAKVAVSTDALGMGVNLPAKKIVFSSVSKFNGKRHELLTPSLVVQIGGRCGRFGYFDEGIVSALNPQDLEYIKKCLSEPINDLCKAYYAPSIEELEAIPKQRLADKLTEWTNLGVIPKYLRDLITPIDMSERIDLAARLTEQQESVLKLRNSYLIINAPVTKSTVGYWVNCVKEITQGKFLSKPINNVVEIKNRDQLDRAEDIIHECELYIWLGNRRQFNMYVDDIETIYETKLALAHKVDKALIEMNIKIVKKCLNCFCDLELFHKHKLCNDCYFGNIKEE